MRNLALARRSSSESLSSAESWTTAPSSSSAGLNGVPEHESEADIGGNASLDFSLPSPGSNVQPPETSGDTIYQGPLTGIKLTGDPNIPRGEYTFIAPDIGEEGLLRVAQEEIFRGARVVRSLGHIAARGFREDDFIPSQLILISHDRLAQYWETFGHVSFYQRVDIDSFLNVA